MRDLLKIPLIIAAVIVVVRIALEEMGAPGVVNNIFGVNWLYLLVPIYFAVRIAGSGLARPYMELLKVVFVFALLTRLMVSVTYSLAYVFKWSAFRFSVAGGGVVGEGVTPLSGMLLTPLTSLAIGTVAGVIIGMIIGSITLAIALRRQ